MIRVTANDGQETIEMEIEERVVGSKVVLDIKGPLTSSGDSNEKLKGRVRALINRGCSRIVLNLAGATQIDSAGLAELVRCYAMFNRHGGRLTLTQVPKPIEALLSISKLTAIFEGDEGDEPAGVESRLNPRTPPNQQSMTNPLPRPEPESE
jgi:anti-sigma B factor antagonist